MNDNMYESLLDCMTLECTYVCDCGVFKDRIFMFWHNKQGSDCHVSSYIYN